VDERQRLLYDPRRERSACGIGLVADLRGRASRELLDRALAGLAAVGHPVPGPPTGSRETARASSSR